MGGTATLILLCEKRVSRSDGLGPGVATIMGRGHVPEFLVRRLDCVVHGLYQLSSRYYVNEIGRLDEIDFCFSCVGMLSLVYFSRRLI